MRCSDSLKTEYGFSQKQVKVTAIIGAVFITALMLRIFSGYIPVGLAIAADVILPMASMALVFWMIHSCTHPQGSATPATASGSPTPTRPFSGPGHVLGSGDGN